MRRVLRIDDHLGFQLAVARAVLAGGALALLWAWVQARLPAAGPAPAWFLALAVLALGAAVSPPRGLRHGAALLLLAGLGGIVSAAGTRLPPLDLTLWGPALCLGTAVSLGVRGRWQRLLAVAAGTLLALAAALVPAALGTLDGVRDLPGPISALAGGLGAGLVFGAAALLRALRVHRDPVDRELLALLPGRGAGDEIAALVTQAFTTYRESAAALQDHPHALHAAEGLVKKIARFGKRWREIEEQARRSERAQLLSRQEELSRRRAACADEQARAEYERAEAAVAAQLGYLQEIDDGRERAVARLHHQVATLERLRLAALRHRSVDAGKLGEELRTVVDDLARAGQDLDTAAEALAEAPV